MNSKSIFTLLTLTTLLTFSCKKKQVAKGLCDCANTPVTMIVDTTTLRIPNIFTPNGDAINDIWVIEHLEYFPNASIKVIDKGIKNKTVFESTATIKVWDGTFEGERLKSGKYFYEITIGTQKRTGYVCIFGTEYHDYDLKNNDCLQNCSPSYNSPYGNI